MHLKSILEVDTTERRKNCAGLLEFCINSEFSKWSNPVQLKFAVK